MRKRHSIVFAAALFVATACSHAPRSGQSALVLSEDEVAIRAEERSWADDWSSGDAEKILRHYANDAEVQIPGWRTLHGKDSLRNGLHELFGPDYRLTLKFTPFSRIVGGLMRRQGEYSLAQDQPSHDAATWTVANGDSYTVEYKKDSHGSWVIARQTCRGEAAAILPSGLHVPGVLDLYSAPRKGG